MLIRKFSLSVAAVCVGIVLPGFLIAVLSYVTAIDDRVFGQLINMSPNYNAISENISLDEIDSHRLYIVARIADQIVAPLSIIIGILNNLFVKVEFLEVTKKQLDKIKTSVFLSFCCIVAVLYFIYFGVDSDFNRRTSSPYTYSLFLMGITPLIAFVATWFVPRGRPSRDNNSDPT